MISVETMETYLGDIEATDPEYWTRETQFRALLGALSLAGPVVCRAVMNHMKAVAEGKEPPRMPRFEEAEPEPTADQKFRNVAERGQGRRGRVTRKIDRTFDSLMGLLRGEIPETERYLTALKRLTNQLGPIHEPFQPLYVDATDAVDKIITGFEGERFRQSQLDLILKNNGYEISYQSLRNRLVKLVKQERLMICDQGGRGRPTTYQENPRYGDRSEQEVRGSSGVPSVPVPDPHGGGPDGVRGPDQP
jgi:hypothetical protein